MLIYECELCFLSPFVFYLALGVLFIFIFFFFFLSLRVWDCKLTNPKLSDQPLACVTPDATLMFMHVHFQSYS